MMMKTTIGGAVDSLITWFMGMDIDMIHKVMGARSGRYAIVA
jgi:peroxiredoxin